MCLQCYYAALVVATKAQYESVCIWEHCFPALWILPDVTAIHGIIIIMPISMLQNELLLS